MEDITSQGDSRLREFDLDAAGRELGSMLLRQLLAAGIHNGDIVTEGKSDAEIKEQFGRYLSDHFSAPEWCYSLITDHLDDLLEKARAASSAGDREIAVLLYATWAEHWINGALRTALQRRGVSVETFKQIVRDLRFEAKIGWFLEVLDLSPLSATATAALRRVVSLRNEFVHYKWTGRDANAPDTREEDITAAVRSLETVVGEIVQYEAEVVGDGTDALIERVLRGSSATDAASAT